MINVNITIEPPLQKIADAYKNVELARFIQEEIITKLAFAVERFAKQVTPVDTGRLRSSIGVSNSIRQFDAIVQTNVKYAMFVHEGTKYMKARPFMEWGAKYAVQWWNGDIGARLDKHLREKLSNL